jgi:hypothetical protein
MAKFSLGNIRDQLKKQLKNNKVVQTLVTYLNPPTKKEFARLKAEMISEFRQLKVVEAIEYGPGFGDNDFADLLGRGGKGDLFSFLGFKRRQKPINAIIAVLRKMTLRRTIFLTWQVDNFPFVEKIEEATKDQLPWANGYSWVTGLEDGIPGLGQYINAPFAKMGVTQSLSHFGLQKESGPRLNTKPVKWITPFINDWFKRFEDMGFKIVKEV